MRVLLLGGTRFLGRRVAELLLAADNEVHLLHRGLTGSGVEGTVTIVGDRSTGEGLEQVADLRPDAVVDLSSYAADWTRSALAALMGRTGHYAYVSSGAVYRPTPELPWPETTPLGPHPLWGAYAREKLASERLLWEVHEEGLMAVSVFRFPFIMGPGNYADRESFVLSRIEAGRPILLPGGGHALNQLVHVEDAARAIVAALEQRDAASGLAFNCGWKRALTNRGFVELCADVLGVAAEIVPIDEVALGVASETVDIADLVFPFPDDHYALDSSRLGWMLDAEPRADNRQIIEDYVTWWRTQSDRSPQRYAREERALANLKSMGRDGE